MRYVYLEDGQVAAGPRLLPERWGNTHVLSALSQDELRAIGWVPATVPDLDRYTQLSEPDFVLGAGNEVVSVTYTAVDKPNRAELEAEDAARIEDKRVTRIASETARRLRNALPGSDAVDFNLRLVAFVLRYLELESKDIRNVITPEEQSERTQRRNQYLQMRAIMAKAEAAETDGTAPGDIVW